MKKRFIVFIGSFLTVSTFIIALLFLIHGGEVLAETTKAVKKSEKVTGVAKGTLYDVVYPLGKTMIKEIL